MSLTAPGLINAPEKALTRLWHLPPELLSHILHFGISFAAIELWKCGSAPLIRRLIMGGCSNIDLLDSTLWTTSRWPSMLTELRQLKHLRLSRRGERLDHPFKLKKALASLPPTLETLDLDFEEAEEMLMCADCERHEIDDTQWRRVALSRRKMKVNMCNLRELFPCLKKLVLRGRTQLRTMTGIDYGQLPRSLLHLEILSDFPEDPTWNRTELLPRGLQVLKFGKQVNWKWSVPAVSSLPPGLVEFGENPQFMRIAQCMKALPATLTTWNTPWKEIVSSHTISLPSALHTLSVPALLSIPYWANLPDSITDLNLGSIPIKADSMSALPRGLKRLSAHNIDWLSVRRPDFPPALEYLYSESTYTIKNYEGVVVGDHRLPPSITCLDITLEDEDDLACLLPLTRLTDLSISINNVFIDSSKALNLPRSVTSLRLDIDTLHNSFHHNQVIRNLPPGLLELTITLDYSWSLLEIINLPQDLQVLKLCPERSLQSCPEFWRSLPRNLKHLICLETINGMTSSDIVELPTSLVSLSLTTPSFKDARGIIPRLPCRALTSLRLHDCAMRGDELRTLPRTLRHLDLGSHGKLTKVSPKHLKDLPPRLRTLRCCLMNSSIRARDADMLPCSLIDIKIGPNRPEIPEYWVKVYWRHIIQRAREGPIKTPDPRVSSRFRSVYKASAKKTHAIAVK